MTRYGTFPLPVRIGNVGSDRERDREGLAEDGVDDVATQHDHAPGYAVDPDHLGCPASVTLG